MNNLNQIHGNDAYNGTCDYYPKSISSINFSDNSDAEWQDYRSQILNDRGKSQDDFEKYLNIFSSGGLFIGLTLLSKLLDNIIKVEYVFFVA